MDGPEHAQVQRPLRLPELPRRRVAGVLRRLRELLPRRGVTASPGAAPVAAREGGAA